MSLFFALSLGLHGEECGRGDYAKVLQGVVVEGDMGGWGRELFIMIKSLNIL